MASFDAASFEDFGRFLDDRDHLYTLVDNIDWQAQLQAVRLMLSRNRQAGKTFAKTIAKNEAEVETYNGPHHDHWVDQHVDLLHESVYCDAAESMAAIGMVAPMVESTIGQPCRPCPAKLWQIG